MDDKKGRAHSRIRLARWGRRVLWTLALLAAVTVLASLAGVVATARPPTLEWEVVRTRFEPPGMPRSVDDLAVAPDNTVYAASGGRVFRRWAGDKVWRPSDAGILHRVTTLVANPHTGQLYAGTEGGGVFRSADGATWQAVNEGLTDLSVDVLSVGKRGMLYAGTGGGGVFHSADGKTWQAMDEHLTGLSVKALAVGTEGVLYAGTWGGGVFQSADGRTWQVANEGLADFSVSALSVDEAGVLYAGTWDRGVFRSSDGETWQAMNAGQTQLHVNTLAIGKGGVLYAGTWDRGVFRSLDGETWQAMNEGLPELDVRALAIGRGGVLHAGTDSGVFYSEDGEIWQAVNAGLTELGVRTLLVDEGDVLFVGTDGGGLFRSEDGETWQAMSEGLTSLDVSALAVGKEGVLYAGTWGGGVFCSTDRRTWQEMNDGLTQKAVGALAIGEEDVLYAGTWDGGVFRLEAGGTWQAMNEGLTSLDVSALAVGASGTLYAGTWGSGVFRSKDGKTWEMIHDGLTSLAVSTLMVDENGVLYAGTLGGVLRSEDGETWQAMNQGLSSSLVNAITVDEGGGLYAGTSSGVFRSTDRETWQAVNTGLTEFDVRCLAAGRGGMLYVGTYGGVFRSGDGETWEAVNEGVTSLDVSALVIGKGGLLYAGTSGGVFRSESGETWRVMNQGLNSPRVNAMTVHKEGIVYVGTRGGVFRSEDGETWEAVNEGLTSLDVSALAVGKGDVLYAGNDDGIFRLADGDIWQAVNEGLSLSSVRPWAADKKGTLYVQGKHLEQDTGGEPVWVVYTLDVDGVWHPWSPVGWMPGESPTDVGQTASGAFLWACSGRQMWLSQNGRVWLPLAKSTLHIPKVIEVKDDQILFQTFAGAGMLLHSVIDMPHIWNLPATCLTLAAAGWEITDWVKENPVPTALMVLLPTLLVVGLAFNTMRVSGTSFPVAMRLVLFGRLGDSSVDDHWPAWESALHDTLMHRRTVLAADVPAIPSLLWAQVTARYVETHGDEEVVAQKGNALYLESDAAQRWTVAWEQLARAGSVSELNLLDDLMGALSDTLGIQRQSGWQRKGMLRGIVVSAPALRLRFPTRFPIVFVPASSVEAEVDTEVIGMAQLLGLREFFALVIPLEKSGEEKTNALRLRELLLQSPYADDLVVLSHADVQDILMIRHPERRFFSVLLSQVRLSRLSPFIIHKPVPNAMFFGRDEQIRTITQSIGERDFSIVGNRRIGKSSLLRQVERLIPPTGFHSAYGLDLQDISTWPELRNRLIREYDWQSADERPAVFRDFIAFLGQKSKGRMPILLLDEADALLMADAEVGYPLSSVWRSLAQGNTCHLVLCGSRALYRRLHDPASPHFNFTEEIHLGRLSHEKATALITRPMNDMGIELVEREVLVERIIDLSSGHPNLVQWLCRQLVDRVGQERRRYITLDDLKVVSRERNLFAKHLLETAWGDSTPLEKATTALANPDGFTLPDIERELNTHGFEVDEDAVTKALEMLVVYSLLEQQGHTYTFAIRHFPRLLRESQQVDHLIRSWRRSMITSPDKGEN